MYIFELLKYIYDINLLYLFFVQCLIVWDKVFVMFCFGINEEMVNILGVLILLQMVKLVEMNQLVCYFWFDDYQMIICLIQDLCVDDLQQIYIGIMFLMCLFNEVDDMVCKKRV